MDNGSGITPVMPIGIFLKSRSVFTISTNVCYNYTRGV